MFEVAGNAATATASFIYQAILCKLETISCDNLTGYALTTGNLADDATSVAFT